jgi:4-hydroxyphenylacetate decarboxylase small subunit
MSQNTLRHNDCMNFLAVDVTKGICRRTNELVLIDSEVCGSFTTLPKCKNCAFFKENGQETIGTCTAEKAQPWTFQDLIAVTCELYAENK